MLLFILWYDLRSVLCVNEVKREKRETWHWCVRTPLISCPQVRRVTCTEGPLSRTVLFPEQPHPEHHEDDYFHPPHPTLPYPGALGCKPNMQILPVQTGRGTEIQIMTLLLSFLSFSDLFICCTYTTVESGGAGRASGAVTPTRITSLSLSLTPQFFSPPCQQANRWGMLKYHWLHPPPTHPQAPFAFGYPLSSFHTPSH